MGSQELGKTERLSTHTQIWKHVDSLTWAFVNCVRQKDTADLSVRVPRTVQPRLPAAPPSPGTQDTWCPDLYVKRPRSMSLLLSREVNVKSGLFIYPALEVSV